MKRAIPFVVLVVMCVLGAVNAGGCGGKPEDLACRCGGPCPSPTPSANKYPVPHNFPAGSPAPTPEDDAQAFVPSQDPNDDADGGCE